MIIPQRSLGGANVQGPAGTFDLIKTSNVYLLPVSSHDDQIMLYTSVLGCSAAVAQVTVSVVGNT